MIEQTDLMKLLESYKIDYKKVMTDKVLDKGEYFGIKNVLEYLVNEVGINPKNIEKCPSILYLNVNEVRKNYEFLKQQKINISDVETCLHVLSTDNKDLKETYYYVLENYGLMTINRTTSILRFKKDRIIDIEKYGLSKDVTISASVSRRTIYEIEKIIEICKKYNIEITGSVFLKKSSSLQKTIDFIIENYDEMYLTPLIIIKEPKHLSEVMPYLDSLGVLEVIINSASILTLTKEEIEKRVEIIKLLGEDIVKNGKFNSVFGMNKTRLNKKLNSYKDNDVIYPLIEEYIVRWYAFLNWLKRLKSVIIMLRIIGGCYG